MGRNARPTDWSAPMGRDARPTAISMSSKPHPPLPPTYPNRAVVEIESVTYYDLILFNVVEAFAALKPSVNLSRHFCGMRYMYFLRPRVTSLSWSFLSEHLHFDCRCCLPDAHVPRIRSVSFLCETVIMLRTPRAKLYSKGFFFPLAVALTIHHTAVSLQLYLHPNVTLTYHTAVLLQLYSVHPNVTLTYHTAVLLQLYLHPNVTLTYHTAVLLQLYLHPNVTLTIIILPSYSSFICTQM